MIKPDTTQGMFRYILENPDIDQAKKDALAERCDARDAEYDAEAPKIAEKFIDDRVRLLGPVHAASLKMAELYGFPAVTPTLISSMTVEAMRLPPTLTAEEARQAAIDAIERVFSISRHIADRLAPVMEEVGIATMDDVDWLLVVTSSKVPLDAQTYSAPDMVTVEESGRKRFKLPPDADQHIDITAEAVRTWGPMYVQKMADGGIPANALQPLRAITLIRQLLFNARVKEFADEAKVVEMIRDVFPELTTDKEVMHRARKLRTEWELRKAFGNNSSEALSEALAALQEVAEELSEDSEEASQRRNFRALKD